MKICFVAHSSRNGGAERSLLETIDALQSAGVDCVALAPARGPFTDALQGMQVPFRILPFKRWAAREGGSLLRRLARTISTLALALPAALWIRRSRAEIVYTNTTSIGIGALAAWLAGRPHVWHLRELGYDHSRVVFDLGSRLSMGLMRHGSRLFLANSRCVAEHYREALAPASIHVVYQSVQLDTGSGVFEPPAFEGLRLAVIGALTPQKRQDEAIEAVGRLRKDGLEVRLLIVGEGDDAYEDSLRQRVDRLGLADSVEFLGNLDSTAGVIRWADAVIHCSRQEAFGRVTVESMLAGKPVVGACSAGTAELVQHGETGLLYPPGDVPELTSQLNVLRKDPRRASRLGRAAQAWALETFRREPFIETLLGLLQPLVRTSPALPNSAARSNSTSRADVTDSE